MKPKVKALVVEDDLDIREEIEDVLGLLGHGHDWAESQQEAHELIEQNHYHYVLADLEIPARPGRGFAKIEYGKKLIGQIQQIKGRGVIPVIVMTGYHKHGLNLALELLGNGVMDFISKPFGDGTKGKSLPQVIQTVLDRHRRAFPPGVLPGDPPQPFRGGTLAYYGDHIELAGEVILESGGIGHAWDIMKTLRKRKPNGKLSAYSAPKLVRAIDPTGQITDNAIASCIHDLRERITQIMLERCNLTCGTYDVIDNRGTGYRFADWIEIEEHDTAGDAGSDAGPMQGHGPAMTPREKHNGPASKTDDPLTDRQHWILRELEDGVELTRQMVETHFRISKKQAKRELSGLSKQSLIEFMRRPRPGHYVLCERSRQAFMNRQA